MGQYVFDSFYFFLYLYLLFNLNLRLISRTAMNDEKESLSRSHKDEAFCDFPLVRVLAQVLFSIKRSPLKRYLSEYFEFNYIFTKRDCYVVNL